MKIVSLPQAGLFAIALWSGACAHAADAAGSSRLERAVNAAIRPVMERNNVPGMAVGITVRGQRHFFSYGVASKESGQRVTEGTMFEIGSVSKTFTATLAAYARERGTLSFADRASKYWPALAGSSFDAISLIELGTYTAGGLPLQFPDDVTDDEKMLAYFKAWRPAYPPGTRRLYSNVSIGLFGYLAAASMGEPFDDLMQGKLFPMLGLTHTFIRVPPERMGDYAQGYSSEDKPVRVRPGVLDSETYGVKTTAADLTTFLEANIGGAKLDDKLQRAIAATHTGTYTVAGMTQGLAWEMYPYPASLDRLLAGNSGPMTFQAHPVTWLAKPRPPQPHSLLDKTGSTNGFGAYVAFIPARRIGIVILANRNYPNAARVKAAYQILTALERPAS